MGDEEVPTQASRRRLKLGSKRTDDSLGFAPGRSGKAEFPATPAPSHPSPVTIGDRFAAAYTAVARAALLGLEALQDWRTERRLTALRGIRYQAPAPTERNDLP